VVAPNQALRLPATRSARYDGTSGMMTACRAAATEGKCLVQLGQQELTFMNSTNQNRTTDPWGHDDSGNDRESPEGGVPWLVLALAILLVIAAGTGFMVYRARHMRELAVAEAARAQAVLQSELARRAAEKAATTPARISRSFPTAGIKKIIFRASTAESSTVTIDSVAEAIEISGLPAGDAKGYHSPDPNWRETPAAEYGLDFVSAQFGDVLVISTKNEILYIHHHYFLESVALRVPADIEVVRERRKLTGDKGPDLGAPK
jgi:hypothetical protein